MTIRAKTGVQLGGHIYRKGETAEYAGAVTQRIADNFTAEDGTALKVGAEAQSVAGAEKRAVGAVETDEGKIARCVDVMKREGIMQALDSMNVTYSPKSRTEYLAKLLLVSRGEIEG